MKKTISVLILVLLFVGMALPITVQASGGPLIIDDLGKITEKSLGELNDYAREISDTYQLDVVYYLVENTTGQILPRYIEDRYINVEKMNPDGFALAHDLENRKWTIVSFGKAERLITEDTEDRFWDAYNEGETYYEGVLDYLEEVSSFLAGAIGGNLTTAEQAAGTTTEPSAKPMEKNDIAPEAVRNGYVFDGTGTLTNAQIATLNEKAAALTAKRKCDVYIWIVYFVPEEYDKTMDDVEAYVDIFYKRNSLGYGDDRNGMVLLLEIGDIPGERDCAFCTYGSCTALFDNNARESLLDDNIVPLFRDAFSNGNFFKVADTFLVKVEAKFASKIMFDLLLKLAVVILVPMIIAFIICSVWKNQMKTAKIATTAGNYIPAGGFRLTGKSDIFMYRTTSRKYIKSESSSSSGGGGGGSSSSSSGRSSGGKV